MLQIVGFLLYTALKVGLLVTLVVLIAKPIVQRLKTRWEKIVEFWKDPFKALSQDASVESVAAGTQQMLTSAINSGMRVYNYEGMGQGFGDKLFNKIFDTNGWSNLQ